MEKFTVPILGMHCKSCELLIEESVAKVPGVFGARANYKGSSAEITYDKFKPSDQAIFQAIRDVGYEIGENEKLEWISRDPAVYKNFILSAFILLAIYLFASWLGIFHISIGPNTHSGVFIALVVGLVAGVSTCMALVGGLILSLSARHAEKHPEATAKEKFRPHLYFNIGRIIGFAMLGGIAGAIGKAFFPSSNVLGIMTIAVGATMLFLGIKLIEIFPVLRTSSISLPASVSRFFGLHKEVKEYSHMGAFSMGALTFFLPCGFTQAMQLFAVSMGDFAKGALVMSLFALGTTPGLLGIGGLSSAFKGKNARLFFMTVGLGVLILGAYNITNGSRLVSFVRAGQEIQEKEDTKPQIVRMTQDSYGYNPNVFVVKAGHKVRWIITSLNPYSCASFLVVPKLGINQALVQGENIIEFVPRDLGEIPFSCSMGMYRGKFIVEN